MARYLKPMLDAFEMEVTDYGFGYDSPITLFYKDNKGNIITPKISDNNTFFSLVSLLKALGFNVIVDEHLEDIDDEIFC